MTNIDYKKELISLLKSDDEVKNAMEKLEFGCRVKISEVDIWRGTFYDEYPNLIEYIIVYKWQYLRFWDIPINNKYIDNYLCHHWTDLTTFQFEKEQFKEIIWLPLSERFITMYLDKKVWEFNNYNVDYKWIFLHIDDESIFIEIDKNKDFDNQTQETYKQIFLALKEM